MPTYAFRNEQTGEEHQEFMSISSLDEYLETNPHITQLVNGAPSIVSGRGLNKKPDNGFRDLLKHIKKGNSKGITRSTINTF
jgi:hypothetical protein